MTLMQDGAAAPPPPPDAVVFDFGGVLFNWQPVLLLQQVMPDRARNAEEALALARKYPFVKSTAGMHPHDADGFDDATEARVAALLAQPECAAVGETGLDYYYGHSTRDAQRSALARHVALARRFDKPIVLHCRDAEADLRDDKLGAKIRDAELQKVPYMLVVGPRDAEAGTVSVRRKGEGDLGAMPLAGFLERIQDEIRTKKR